MTEEIKEIEQYLKKCSNCFTCNNFLGEDENGGHCMLQNAYNHITNLQKEKEELQRKYLTINENNQNMQEEWRDIEGYNGKYQVSNLGQVRSTDRCYRQLNPKGGVCEHPYKGKILKQFHTKWGYKRIGLSQNGKVKFYHVHKVVAEAFIPNPDKLPCINHIDGDKDNNCVSNLEWCSYSQNNRHARETGLNKGVYYKTRCLKALEYIEKHKYDYEVKERGLHMIQSVVPEFRLTEILKGQITKAQCEKLLEGGDEE